MKKSSVITLTILIAFMTLTGCATNRGIVRLQLPESTVNVGQNGKAVYIESVTDKRIFQKEPKTQDIPSLGFGGSDAATEAIKKRAIARKRNGFGKAMGDILLKEGQTVETVIAATLKQAFSETGYKIIPAEENITNDTIIVKATIQKFWAYMTPGFWAITLSSDISTDIEMISNGNQQETITVHSDGKYQFGSGANWLEIIDLSIKKYISEVKNKI
jgi:hypothetical protein